MDEMTERCDIDGLEAVLERREAEGLTLEVAYKNPDGSIELIFRTAAELKAAS